MKLKATQPLAQTPNAADKVATAERPRRGAEHLSAAANSAVMSLCRAVGLGEAAGAERHWQALPMAPKGHPAFWGY